MGEILYDANFVSPPVQQMLNSTGTLGSLHRRIGNRAKRELPTHRKRQIEHHLRICPLCFIISTPRRNGMNLPETYRPISLA